jgi:hypothetical protein
MYVLSCKTTTDEGNDTWTLPRKWWRPGFVAENPSVGRENITLLLPSGTAEM